jgi:hypothetical protein
MSTAKPDWDLLMGADEQDIADHSWFPADRARTVTDFRALEGMRFRNVYLTSKALENGSATLFQILYRTTIITGVGKVLHVSDYREA